jgi:hypothetical protein
MGCWTAVDIGRRQARRIPADKAGIGHAQGARHQCLHCLRQGHAAHRLHHTTQHIHRQE